MTRSSSVLYSSADSCVLLVDIPRSIELAQGPSSKRVVSSQPREIPFPLLEPKSTKAKANAPNLSLDDLLLSKRLDFALQELRENQQGPWCLPRVDEPTKSEDLRPAKKQKLPRSVVNLSCEGEKERSVETVQYLDCHDSFLYHNPNPSPLIVKLGHEIRTASIPPRATVLFGDILKTLSKFVTSAPQFRLAVLDPPWPNRSARRVKSYNISYSTHDIHQLLASIPLEDHLADDGVIAIWITNKVLFREMVIGEGGLFQQWGVRHIEEWIWLKTTKSGEPICPLNSTWRRPYEILLVGKKVVGPGAEGVRKRVIVAVPDIHSRKPNLNTLFEDFGLLEAQPLGDSLEIFARNLTAGWWAWGNEVLKFQMEDCWVESSTLVQNSIDAPWDIE